MSEDKKYVGMFLPKELAKQVEALGEKTPDDLILAYIKECKKDMQQNIECMDEDLLMFKGSLARVRKDFNKAKKEHLDASYEIWEKYSEDIKTVNQQVERFKRELGPLKDELNDVLKLFDKVSSYQIRDLLESIACLNAALNGSGNNGNMLKFLIENYKKG